MRLGAAFRIIFLALLALFVAQIKADELGIEILTEGTDCTPERTAARQDRVTVHYHGELEDGKVFDSSINRNEPFKFRLGKGMVIPGWEQGILGMCIGEKRKLTIPYELAYGARGIPGTIPEKATLIFTVDLLDLDRS